LPAEREANGNSDSDHGAGHGGHGFFHKARRYKDDAEFISPGFIAQAANVLSGGFRPKNRMVDQGR
jgi:hypothetical protein